MYRASSWGFAETPGTSTKGWEAVGSAGEGSPTKNPLLQHQMNSQGQDQFLWAEIEGPAAPWAPVWPWTGPLPSLGLTVFIHQRPRLLHSVPSASLSCRPEAGGSRACQGWAGALSSLAPKSYPNPLQRGSSSSREHPP